VAGVLVRVVDNDDHDMPPGEIGEVITRRDCVICGYWQNAEANADTLRGGCLHTGGLGSVDEDGLLTLRDRSKDMIISGGSNIYSREIEEVVLSWCRARASLSRRRSWTAYASTTSPASSGRAITVMSKRSQRTITARS
jgi:acyl-CoA synthetase (AMP-forming)/AMP-acid ligase II